MAATFGRLGGNAIDVPAAPRAATSGTSASGAWSRKIHSQPIVCVSTPPTAGPIAAPSTPAATQMRIARSALPSVARRRSSAAVITSAPPAACTQRAATSVSKDGASPQASEAAAKTSVPTTNATTGRRRATIAAGTASSASTRLYDVSTHATVVIPTSNSRSTSGSASVTTDESASAIPIARPSSRSVHSWRESRSDGRGRQRRLRPGIVRSGEANGRARAVSLTAQPAYVDLTSLRDQAKAEVARVVVGQEDAIDLLLVAALAHGHVLLEGPPGSAKTLLGRAMAYVFGAEFRRMQFTPDTTPSEITGHYEKRSGELVFVKGVVFANVLLADEINRTPPRTQAALLEAMQERTVTVDGQTHRLPDPFLVIATQNPYEHEGIHVLPESQLDRFLFKIDLDYCDAESEVEMLRLPHTGVTPDMLGEIRPLLGIVGLDKARHELDTTEVPEDGRPLHRPAGALHPRDRRRRARRQLPRGDPPPQRGEGARPPRRAGRGLDRRRAGHDAQRAPPPPHLQERGDDSRRGAAQGAGARARAVERPAPGRRGGPDHAPTTSRTGDQARRLLERPGAEHLDQRGAVLRAPGVIARRRRAIGGAGGGVRHRCAAGQRLLDASRVQRRRAHVGERHRRAESMPPFERCTTAATATVAQSCARRCAFT